MAEIALNQLTEAKAQLVAQEEELSAQLSALQEKIQGLQTVIAMFSDGVAAAAVDSGAETEAEEPSVAKAEPEEVVEAPPVRRRGRPRKSEVAARTSSRGKAKAAVAAPKKRRGPGRSAKWQEYIRDEYRATPLPDVVANVLKAKPKQVFKIAAVMDELFPADDMPKADFLKARNRVSNILSAGARSGDWHRGRGGTYSCTKRAVA